MSWPDIVRSLRIKCGAKQDALSSLVGVSQATISRWESGRQLPSEFYRQKLLDLYRHHVAVDPTGFRGGTGDGASKFLVHLDQDLRHLYVDARGKCYNDQAVDEMLGRHPWETWLSPAAQSRFEAICRQAMASGQDGEFDHSGALSLYRTRVSWKPERKRLEVETSRVECDVPQIEAESVAALLTGCRSIGLVKADDERIRGANDAFLDLIGRNRDHLVTGGIRWADIIPPEFAERDRRVLSDLRRKGELEPYETEYFHHDGGRVPVLLAGRALRPEPLLIVVTVIDVSRRRVPSLPQI